MKVFIGKSTDFGISKMIEANQAGGYQVWQQQESDLEPIEYFVVLEPGRVFWAAEDVQIPVAAKNGLYIFDTDGRIARVDRS